MNNWIKVYFSIPLVDVSSKEMNNEEIKELSKEIINLINQSYLESFVVIGKSPYIFIDEETGEKIFPYIWKYKKNELWNIKGERTSGIIIYPASIRLTTEDLSYLRPALVYADNNLSKELGISEKEGMTQEVGNHPETKNPCIMQHLNFLMVEYDIKDRLESYNTNPKTDENAFGAPFPVELKNLINQMKSVCSEYTDKTRAESLENWIIEALTILKQCESQGFLKKLFKKRI